MRVLVVDDDRKLADLVQRGLGAAGMTVDVAHSGDDALRRAGSTRYDAIVLDVMMPGIDGITTCRRLRDDDVWSPVLLLTARDAIEDRVAGLDAGADDYLVKPRVPGARRAIAGAGAAWARRAAFGESSMSVSPRRTRCAAAASARNPARPDIREGLQSRASDLAALSTLLGAPQSL